MSFRTEGEKHVPKDPLSIGFNLQRLTVQPSEMREELQRVYCSQFLNPLRRLLADFCLLTGLAFGFRPSRKSRVTSAGMR
jgi:hypothetical protein